MMHLPLWSGLAPDLVITPRLEAVLALVQGYDLVDCLLIASFNHVSVLCFKGLAKNTPEEYGFLIDHALESPSKSLKE